MHILYKKIKKYYLKVQKYSRERRFSFFIELFQPNEKEYIMDLGGADGSYFCKKYPQKEKILLVDKRFILLSKAKKEFKEIKIVCADACNLPFNDRSIDFIFSNSVIEHINDQERFANEVIRVYKKGYFVQTPNKMFPFESHYMLPLFQFLPIALQRYIYDKNLFSFWEPKRFKYEKVHYLKGKKLKRLFPEGNIKKEKFIFLNKSFYCYKKS